MRNNAPYRKTLGSGFESQSTQAPSKETSGSARGKGPQTVTRDGTKILLGKVCRRLCDENEVIGHTEWLVSVEDEKWTRIRDEGTVWEWNDAIGRARQFSGAYAVVVDAETAAVIECERSARVPKAPRTSVEEYQQRMEALKLA